MILKKKKGQMSIFIALIFQIIFVLFAMTVNVSLVIYDKINLQNAVDLAAYYAAQKQAEILNVIAHQNYQIRQSWKLLSFRYRVLGTLGLTDHPIRRPQEHRAKDEEFSTSGPPQICLINQYWDIATGNLIQNTCKRSQYYIPAIPPTKVIAPIGYVIRAVKKNRQTLEDYRESCQRARAINWYYMAKILSAYRLDQQNRRQVIQKMAEILKTPNFKELDGVNVGVGTRKTFYKNLSEKNKESPSSLRLLNSLRGLGEEDWLPFIEIHPLIVYSYLHQKNSGACETELYNNYQNHPENQDILDSLRPLGITDSNTIKVLKALSNPNTEWEKDNTLTFSLGVEKNPWMMAYVGVEATLSSRPIFTPFQTGRIQLQAQGFAKPFGGRVGPWAYNQWPHGSYKSDGKEPYSVEQMFSPRNHPQDILKEGTSPQTLKKLKRFYPNFSRFPGDTLGLRSRKALSDWRIDPSTQLDLTHYNFGSFDNNTTNDILASPVDSGERRPLHLQEKRSVTRALEIAAIRPNMFDVYYYSVFANFGQSYLKKLVTNKSALGLNDIVLRGDLMSRSLNFNEVLSIKDQFHEIYTKKIRNPPKPRYMLTDQVSWQRLLTSWSFSEPRDYSLNENHFMTCKDQPELLQQIDSNSLKLKSPFFNNPDIVLPHGCIGNARTGYSVKMISKDFLESQGHVLGGKDRSSGPIQNPPSSQSFVEI